MPDVQSAFHMWVVQGGVMMFALIPCLILTVAYIIQGCLNLRRRRLAPEGFAQRLREARAAGGMQAVREELARADHSLGEIIRSVMAHLDFKPDADPAEVLDDRIAMECDMLLQQNSQLALIYRIGPQMGLLGTVFGMIDTFNNFATSANPEVSILSSGINVALISTAWGLVIAIPAYTFFYLFNRRVAGFEQGVFPREGADALHAILDRQVSA